MFEIFFMMLAAMMGPGDDVGAVVAAPVALSVDGFDMSVVPTPLTAEPQTPSGKFTTAQEVKPILDATKGSWVAVREYEGQDLLYVTHLWAWRCGLAAIAVSVNDAPLKDWPLPACHMDYAAPNAVLETDGLPYMVQPLGSVARIKVQIVYDDLTMDIAEFDRGSVLIP